MFHQRKLSENHDKIEGEIADKELRIEPTGHKTNNFPRGLIPKEIGNL